MKYIVTTNETYNVTVEYLVEADSGDEAAEKIDSTCIIDEIFNFIENEEILNVQPYIEN